MQKTIKIKLIPTKEQQAILDRTSKEYIRTVNRLVSKMVQAERILDLSTKEFFAYLPSAVKNQCIRDAKNVYKKHKKGITKSIAILKKPVCIWNNQNFSIEDTTISFPVWLGKSKKISVKALIPIQYKEVFENKLGALRITKKANKYIAQITLEVEAQTTFGTNTMGVDLGIKVPAVCVTSNNKTKFIGKGRENKYIRRRFKAKRKALGKAKKLNAIKNLNNKEQRIMQDRDHKYSRQIVNFALENNVSVIRLEELSNIRNTTRTSRKNNHSLHNWSFYRLAQFIEYKAQLVGIKVEYVNPSYTSQICPNCGTKNKAKDRLYNCSCGLLKHRDVIGATNIMSMTHGNSVSA
ncbi:MAG: RNA-guided endonuclease InsQ/TnpB family protein [Cellulosilyticaceae bacterium]